jgi:hypothetical protein
MALAWAELAVFQKAGSSKESEKSRSPTPGRASGVGVGGCRGKAEGVGVGGNQTVVAVGESVGWTVGVRVAVGTGPAQATNTNPQPTISNIFLPHFCFI